MLSGKGSDRRSPAHPGRGFTIIELLIVVGIIAILVSLVVVVGKTVVTSGRGRLTLDTIRTMDTALGSFESDAGRQPPAVVEYQLSGGGPRLLMPIVDGFEDDPVEPMLIDSVAWFILQVSERGSVEAHFKGIDAKLMTRTGEVRNDPALRTMLDAWQRPLRYVHPKFDGLMQPGFRSMDDPPFVDQLGTGQTWATTTGIRRNNTGDSDGGLCVGNHPYFYSAGPDGDPSTIEDNVYSTKPQFAKE